MASRSEKMYSDSPKIERGEGGKHEVKRTKRANKPKHDMGEMGGRHARELAETHKRHEDEMKALHARHQKEADAAEAAMPAAGGADQDAGADQGAAPPAQA